ncbi:MAG: hypothetical protein ACLT5P_02065 [Flavonifractor plautii]
MAYSVVIWLVTLAIPELLIWLFNEDLALIAAGVPAFGFTTQPLRSCHSDDRTVCFCGAGAVEKRHFFSAPQPLSQRH